jgi:hypothetical protein
VIEGELPLNDVLAAPVTPDHVERVMFAGAGLSHILNAISLPSVLYFTDCSIWQIGANKY